MKWTVKLYYSGYIEREVEAECEARAIRVAREQVDRICTDREDYLSNYAELLDNIEPWQEADEVSPSGGDNTFLIACGYCEGSGCVDKNGNTLESGGLTCPACKGKGFVCQSQEENSEEEV